MIGRVAGETVCYTVSTIGELLPIWCGYRMPERRYAIPSLQAQRQRIEDNKSGYDDNESDYWDAGTRLRK